jgi:rRNA maturation RNase YbeY
MMVEIRVLRQFSSRVARVRLRAVVRRVARAEGRLPDLTIVITDDAAIRRLNRAFHGTDAPTDVLAFEAGEPDYLGDVIISYETARRNARAAGWRIADELDLLVVHGVLHLLGYDDTRPRARAKMWKRQEEILGRRINAPLRAD